MAGADSGVYLRGTPQVQIWDVNQIFDPKNPNRKPHQGSGGEGAEMENFWDREKPLPPKGPIMLQNHGGEIRWRNIFIREINTTESPVDRGIFSLCVSQS